MSPTVLCLVFSLAGVSQAPSPNDSVASPERQKALLEQIHRRNATPESKAKISAEKARIIAANKAARERYIAEQPYGARRLAKRRGRNSSKTSNSKLRRAKITLRLSLSSWRISASSSNGCPRLNAMSLSSAWPPPTSLLPERSEWSPCAGRTPRWATTRRISPPLGRVQRPMAHTEGWPSLRYRMVPTPPPLTPAQFTTTSCLSPNFWGPDPEALTWGKYA